MAKFKKAYRVFSSGMVNGRCRRAHHAFDVGAKNKKHALEILKKEFNKTSKYSIVWEHATDLGIPVGSFMRIV